MSPGQLSLLIGSAVLLTACARETTPPQGGDTAPGTERTATTAALETGANLLQSRGPLSRMSMHLVGFHPSKADPSLQMESHHFCDQANEDFMQCVLYDGDAAEARLHGIEYIISEKLYAALPAEERPYWHPHNYEILSGTLRMPNLPDAAENAAMRRKMNSYGKTWHVWKTGVHGQPPDMLPFGPAHLAWSFNADGQADPEMIAARDARMALDTGAARHARADLVSVARPQAGVDAMKGRFRGETTPLPGVTDNGTPGTAPVPRLMLQQPGALPQ